MIRRPPRSTLFPYDALPIFKRMPRELIDIELAAQRAGHEGDAEELHRIFSETGFLGDRKSTRLNSSHVEISYAVFCLKKKTTGRYSKRPRVQPLPQSTRILA